MLSSLGAHQYEIPAILVSRVHSVLHREVGHQEDDELYFSLLNRSFSLFRVRSNDRCNYHRRLL